MTKERRNLLLALLALLAALRLFIVPWTDTQEQNKQAIEAATRRLEKSQELVAKKPHLEAAAKKLSDAYNAMLKSLPAAKDQAQFRLDMQKRIQKQLPNAASLSLFDWISDAPIDVKGVYKGTFRAQLSGPAWAVAQAQVALEKQNPTLRIDDVTMNWSRQLQQDTEVRVTLVATVLFRLEAA